MSGAADREIRVLCVDDDPDRCETAALRLERVDDGLEVVAETSAADGLARLETDDVDCVVSDHDSAGTDDLEFLRAVREREETLPFVRFTGTGSEAVAAEASAAGVTAHLQKGTGTDQYALLANRIRRAGGERRPVDLAVLARESWAVLDVPRAKLAVEEPGDVEVDQDRLRELFENPHGNAVDHATADGRAVTVRVGPTEDGFFVEDDGRGISPDLRDVVFERGYTTSEDGTGFGLAIVADVVEARDWTVAVVESGDGSARFEIAL